MNAEKNKFMAIIETQEEKIASLEKLIYGVGNDQVLADKAKDLRPDIDGVQQTEVLDYILDLQEDPENPAPRATEMY